MTIAGCGRKESAETNAPDLAVRGEPIRGEPIASAPTDAAGETGSNKEPVTAASNGTAAAAESVASGAPTSPGAPADTAPAGSPVTATTAETPSKGTSDKPLSIGFEKLASFQYEVPDGPIDTNTVRSSESKIPPTIQGLNNSFVSLKGFMLPLKVEKGLVTELLILRDQSMCCYGSVPKITEWVSVKMAGPGIKPVMDQPVTLFGKLKVGEVYENGYLVGIYAMDGERMAGPLDL